MRIKNIFKLAIKDLKREKKNFWLCAFGISVGIWLLVFMVSFGEGVKKEIKENITSMSEFNIINIFYSSSEEEASFIGSTGASREIPKSELQEIRKFPEVKEVFRSYQINASLELGENKTASVPIDGIPLEVISSTMKSRIIYGKFLEKENEVVLDSKIARILNKNTKDLIGKKIIVTPIYLNPDPYSEEFEVPLPPYKLKVSGVIEFSENMTDSRAGLSYVHIEKAKDIYKKSKSFLKKPSFEESYRMIKKDMEEDGLFLSKKELKERVKEDAEITAMDDSVPFVAKVFVEDKDDVKSVINKLKKMGFANESEQMIIEEINKAIFVLEAILATFGIIALFASIFGIVNVMYLMTRERKREIGILKSVGARKNDIVLMFLAEGGFIGLAGGMMGIFFAFIAGKFFSLVLNKIFFSELGEEGILGMGIPQISSHIPIWLFLLSLAIAIFFAVLAASAPAERAAKTKTVEMLKYD